MHNVDEPISTLEKTIYGTAERSDVAAAVPDGAIRILDIGCAAGKLGAQLKQRAVKPEVTGVELNTEMAAKAENLLDRVHVGSIETVMGNLPDGYFDCVILADVLEHMINPFQVLADIRPKLAPGATVVASIPNARHYRVIRSLAIHGKWEYGETGLLDSGHLRFFTLHGIMHMFDWAGFDARVVSTNRHATLLFWRLNRLLGGRISGFLEYQYIVTATPRSGELPRSEAWWAHARVL